MKKKMVVIAIPIIVVIAAIFVFGIQVYKKSYSNFPVDGYIIDVDSSSKYYFSQDGRYKINKSSGNVAFEDSSQNDVKVEDASFIHYVDGSISTFKKSVVLDLDKMDSDAYQYYNFFPGSIFTKTGKGYKIAYLDKNLSMSNFLLKITEDKYMIVGDKILIQIGDETKTIKDSYIEVNYLDGNIIRLDNNEVSYQNISANLSVDLGNDTTIDFLSKKIKYKGEEVLNLGEITIDSNDNIDIIVEEENQFTKEEETDENGKVMGAQEILNNSTSKTLHKFNNVSNGIVDVDTEIVEQVIEENAAIKDAEFTISDVKVDCNKISGEVSISDPAGTLSDSNIVWYIVESGTNKKIYSETISNGNLSFEVNYEQLTPETNYVLIVNADYTKNGMVYNKDFIQKTFITSPIGIEISKKYAKTDTVAFNISRKNYSNVSKFDMKLVDPEGKTVASASDVNFASVSSGRVFSGLKSNTSYTLVLNNFSYDALKINGGESITYSIKTLKRTPVVGGTAQNAYIVDKKNDKFTLYLNNIRDIDNGIVSYRAEVYDAYTDALLFEKESYTNNALDIPVDGDILTKNNLYRIVLYYVFNDNEKTYEVQIGEQELIMDSKTVPTGSNSFTDEQCADEDCTWEKVKGSITIMDPNDTIQPNTNFILYYQNLSVDSKRRSIEVGQVKENGNYVFDFEINNLKSESDYLFQVVGNVDIDNNGYVSNYIIYSFTYKTKKPDYRLRLVGSKNESTGEIFDFTARIANEYDTITDDYEAKTLSEFDIYLYSGDFIWKDDEQYLHDNCIPDKECWHRPLIDENPAAYESTVKDNYYDKTFTINSAFFNANPSSFSPLKSYTLKAYKAYDYTEFKNEIGVDVTNSTYTFNLDSGAANQIPSDIKVKEIYNSNAADGKKNPNLKDDTKVGFKVTAVINDITDQRVSRIIYYVKDNDGNVIGSKIIDQPQNNSMELYFDDFDARYARGKICKFSYEYYYSNNYDDPHVVKSNDGYLAEKEIPTLELFLDHRGSPDSVEIDDVLYFKYYYKDNDDALLNPYFQLDHGFGTPIELQKTTSGTLGTLAIELPRNAGILEMYHTYSLYDDDPAHDPVQDISMTITPAITKDDYYSSTYSIEEDNDSIIFNIDMINSNYKRVLGANITFNTEDNTEIVLKDLHVNDGAEYKTIEVSKASIASLKNKGGINTELNIIYDDGVQGVNNDSPYGNILQYTSNTNYRYSDNNNVYHKYYKTHLNDNEFYNTFGKTKNMTITDLDNNTIGNIVFDNHNGYFEFDNATFTTKRLSQVALRCVGVCYVNGFDNLIPSFKLEDTEVYSYPRSIFIRPTISGVEESIKDKVVVKANYSKYVDNHCDTNNQRSKTANLLDVNENGMIIDDLDYSSEYCLNFEWYENNKPNQMNEFYYNKGDLYDKTYYVFTQNNIQLDVKSPVYTIYDESQISENHSDGVLGRFVNVSYDVSSFNDYDGVEITFYTKNGDRVKINNNQDLIDDTNIDYIISKKVNNTSYISKYIDIGYVLQSDTDYSVHITPYYYEEGVKEYYNSYMMDFRYSINKPSVTITNSNVNGNDVNNEISIDFAINDYDNATYEQKKYDIYVFDTGVYASNNDVYAESTYPELGKKTNDSPITFNRGHRAWNRKKIPCTGTCKITVVYKANLGNTNSEDYDTYFSSTRTFTLNQKVVLAEPNTINTSDTENIYIQFAEYKNTQLITKMIYAIYTNDGDLVLRGERSKDDDGTAIIQTDGVSDIRYVVLNHNLQPGSYKIIMAFQYEYEVEDSEGVTQHYTGNINLPNSISYTKKD